MTVKKRKRDMRDLTFDTINRIANNSCGDCNRNDCCRCLKTLAIAERDHRKEGLGKGGLK